MHSGREQNSPYDGDRFLLREDSGRWPANPNGQPATRALSHRMLADMYRFLVDAPKVVRWASLASTASDKDELIPPPPQLPATTHPSIMFLAALITALLAITAASHFAGENPTYSSYLTNLIPTSPSPTTILSPALKAAIEELVGEVIHARDVANRGARDYALKANGGCIALQVTSVSRGFLTSREGDPSVAIDDDVHAGRCWSFGTLPCQLGIRLPQMIHPSHVTVEHFPKQLLVDVGQAPKNMTLWGVVDGRGNTEIYEQLVASGLPGYIQRAPPITRDLLWAPLVSFIYDIDHDDFVQTFPIDHPIVDSGMTFGVVALEVLDNWGSDTTCLYRVRVHGSPA